MKSNEQSVANLKRESLTERMRSARDRGVVALQRYNTLRATHPEIPVLALEGDDDPIFYQTSIRAIESTFEWKPLVCKGKDHVLSLRALLKRNLDSDANKTFYLIDNDFDGTKGHSIGPDLYVTPTYSIENFLVTENALRELLVGEYKCSDGDETVECIVTIFLERLDEFNEAMRLANQALHHCRTQGIKANSVENKIKKYVRIDLSKIEIRYTVEDLPRLVGVAENFHISQLEHTKINFELLDPIQNWRGKYLMAFFIEFLALLQEDRCQKEPTYFRGKRPINFNPKTSIVRTLSSICPPPTSLRTFIAGIAVYQA